MTDFKKWVLMFWNKNKMILTAMITILVLYYPVGLFHEFGHYLVGLHSGSSCVIHWWLAGECYPLPEPFMLYWALGGIFGTALSLSIISLRRIRKNKEILLGVITLAFSQFVNFVFETFFHFAYITSPIATMFMASLVGFFLILFLVFFTQRSKRKA